MTAVRSRWTRPAAVAVAIVAFGYLVSRQVWGAAAAAMLAVLADVALAQVERLVTPAGAGTG